jgi:3-oxoacyl-[acyl-carrier-protein] synthase II
MNRVRVVVTGMGVVTPVGIGIESFWQNIITGISGIAPITRFDASKHDSQIAGEVKGFDPLQWLEKKEARKMDLFIHFAVAAAQMAYDDSGLKVTDDNRERVGVFVGTGIGGIPALEESHRILLEKGPGRISAFFIPSIITNMASGQISIRFGMKGPNSCVCTACATGNHAIGDSFRIIQRGEADVMLAGGSEAVISPLTIGGFCSMKALSTRNDEPTRASRPFDKERDGFVMGEGSGLLVLEELEYARRRKAKIYAELVGYGMSADAFHITQPAPDGAVRSMRLALKDAQVTPSQVNYINAHGTSTPAGDVNETVAVKTVFSEHARSVPMSSTKSMTGHLLGAAGGIESVITVLAVSRGILPPTINYETPDPECDLDYVPNTARRAEVRYALTNSFGFGGTNASLLFKKFED